MRLWMAAAGLLLILTGCHRTATRPEPYQSVAEDANRDTKTARLENAKALKDIDKGELDPAEKALKAALTADPFFGPAHNNLGIVYMRQKKHYQAAWEFQYAAKLMPYSPEPRSNLGMVYEAVGRLDAAEKYYGEALNLQPDNPELIGNLARTLVRENRKDERTAKLLQDLVMRDTRLEWVAWAKEHLALLRTLQAAPTEIKPAPKLEKAPSAPPPPSPPSPTPPGGTEDKERPRR